MKAKIINSSLTFKGIWFEMKNNLLVICFRSIYILYLVDIINLFIDIENNAINIHIKCYNAIKHFTEVGRTNVRKLFVFVTAPI